MPNSNSYNTNEAGSAQLMKAVSSIINKVVGRYVARGVIPEREREDVEMSVMEKFLVKKDKINGSFEGKAQLTTYYTAVINRMCCEVIRKEQKHWYSVKEQENKTMQEESTRHFDTAKLSLLKEELKRFQYSLLLFDELYYKVLLFLKYYFDIPIRNNDLDQYAKGKTIEALELLGERRELSKAEINERLAQLVFLAENKKVGGDAVRMWINKQLEVILCRMNGNNHSFHTKESIAIMLEMEYTKNSEN